MRKRKPSGGLLLLLLVKMPDFWLQGPPGFGLYSISGTATKDDGGGKGAAHKKRLSCCQDADEDEDEDEDEDDVERCQRTTT